MANATRKINFTGWINMNTALVAAVSGYQGGIVKRLQIMNNNAGAVTVHLNDTAMVPSDATQGFPIGSTAGTAPGGTILVLENADISQIWLNNAADAQDIIVLVNGNR